MYKVIIVDDEYPIRKGLQNYIEWEKIGFQVVKTFPDGLSALEFLRVNDIDVVMTDIDMPIMNGIKLVENIRNEDLAKHCVIISGYQDFEYARRLLQLHVNSYLLKPIENEAVEEIFKEIYEMLQKAEKQKHKRQEDKKALELMRTSLRQQFFSDLFLQKNTLQLAQKKLDRLDLGFNEKEVNIFYAQLRINNLQELLDSDWHYGIDALYDSVTNFVKRIKPEITLSDFQKGRNVLCFVAVFYKYEMGDSLEKQQECYVDIFNQAIQKIHEISNVTLSLLQVQGFCSLGAMCTNTADITFEGEQKEVEQTQNSFELSEMPSEQLSYIYNAINSSFVERDLNDVFDRVDLLFSKVQNYILADAYEVYIMLVQILLRQLPDSHNIFNSYESKLSTCENVYDMNAHTKKFIEYIKKDVPINPDNHLNLLMEHAKKYIEDNYSKNISRNDVADYMFLSPSYFSRCFKKQTGMKFIDYLTKFRIEKSCELLLDSANNISSVCQAVGYNSPSYFTRVFKSVMGLAPNEYIRANIS